MSRIVETSSCEPFRLEAKSHSVWLCQCGLSQNKPFCDGSHGLVMDERPGTICAYQKYTQKRIRECVAENLVEYLNHQGQQQVIFEEDNLAVTWLNAASPSFMEVLRIRASLDGAVPDSCFDLYDFSADHYILSERGMAVACMRVNQARRGVLDCEDFYPPTLLGAFRSCVGSASRLVRLNEHRACPNEITKFIVEVWRHQYQSGMRLDLINCHEPMEPFYLRLGYRRIRDSQFRHPRLSTPSLVLVLVADCQIKSPLRDAFDGSDADLIAKIIDQISSLSSRETKS